MSSHSITYTVVLLSISNAYSAEAKPGTESFENLITKLKYGDRCSWKAEKIRQACVETIVEMDKGMPDYNQLKYKTLEEFKLNVTKNGNAFCNALELLICNNETETCGCGDPGRAVVLGEQAGSKHYIVEMTDDGQQRCRWAKNKGCAPVGDNGNVALTNKCQKGTSCIAVGKEHACSSSDISLYELNNKITDVSKLTKDVLNAKVCSCQSGEQTKSQGDNLDKKIGSRNSRVRRFASGWRPNPDMSVYDDVIALFVDSF